MEELFVAILSMLLVLALIPLFVWKRRKDSSSTDIHEEGQDQAEEEGYEVSKLHKTPHSDSPLEEEGPKDTKGVWWIKSILGR